jgi:site-specific recombinase XerD
MSDELDPLSPSECVSMWLDRQRATKSDETIQSYSYRLSQFVEWCDSEGIENLNDLSERDVLRFDSACRADDLSRSTLNNRLGTLRQFLAFASDANAVAEGVPAAVDVPSLDVASRVNDELLAASRAESIIGKLDRYRFGSRDHALLQLAWYTGCRLGALRALDLRDVYLTDDDLPRLRHYPEVSDAVYEEVREAVRTPFVYYRHRPDSGTPLKNGEAGRRPVALDDETARVLRAWREVNRPDVLDKHDRAALFASRQGSGRLSKAAIRRAFYVATQPCRMGGDCPHGRDIETCTARQHGRESACPSARSPHPVRTGSITDHRDRGWPPEDLAERVNATPEVIRQHYDHPQLLRRMESRRRFLDGEGEES